jgi:SAM-dependent methyltransferase
MGIKLNREKRRSILLSICYRFSKVLAFSTKKRFKIFLDLEWIFDRLAHEESFKYYNSLDHPIRIHTLQFIKKHCQPNYSVLDIGCNSGEITQQVANFTEKVVGVDYNKKIIEAAQKNNTSKNVEFIHCDAFDYLKNQAKKVDLVILSHILEHLDNPKDFITNCALYTNHIYIEVPDYEKTYLNLYRAELGNKLNYTDSDHVWEFDRVELLKVIQDCNIKIIDCEFKFGIIKIWCSI